LKVVLLIPVIKYNEYKGKNLMSILSKEINEQPDAIRELLNSETDHVTNLSKELHGRYQYVVIAARGSSDNAARYAQYLFGAHNRLQVSLATPSLFTLYHAPPQLNGALVLAVSQSGQSPDIVEVIAESKRQGCPTLVISNAPNSPLAMASEYHLYIHAGPEKAVAASKSYTASLGALALLSTAMGDDRGSLDQLRSVPDVIESVLNGLSTVVDRVERYRYMAHCAVIGRGYNYSTAFEVALKIKELTRTVTEPYSSADFRHGPIATVRDGFPVILIAPRGSVFDDVRELATDVHSLGAELLIISDDQALLHMAHLAMPLPGGLPEWLTPLVTVLPGQLFAVALAEAKGLDPDSPTGLRKVTETK
jgi:glucosamine--fructose-6-phosphate aminotransferase (isomerizing)